MNLKSLARKAASAYRRSQSAKTRPARGAAPGPGRRHASPKAEAVKQAGKALRKR